MNIKEFLNDGSITLYSGPLTTDVLHLSINSNQIQENTLFIAIEGTNVDGHTYIQSAIDKGAKAILINQDKINFLPTNNNNITILTTKDTRSALSLISNIFYNNPSASFHLIGITGTNGKTSIASIIHQILLHNQQKTALIGTLGEFINKTPININKTTPTTPDAIELLEFMRYCADQNVENVVMEVSSMSLKLKRVAHCAFDVGVFTNITPEHLDDHKTFEDYFASKSKLFELAKRSVINIDDPYGVMLAKQLHNPFTYSITNNTATIYADRIVFHENSATCQVYYMNRTYPLRINVPANYAISNSLASIAVCLIKGLDMNSILTSIEAHNDVEGHYEELTLKSKVRVIIDYAHNAGALENLLSSIKENRNYRRLITVFGCTGNRDRSKRPIMGAIASNYSDYVIITSDDPHDEDPEAIIKEILTGIEEKKETTLVIPSRKKAIKKALDIARAEDIIVIAGKGHENEQIVKGGKRVPLNDKQEVLNY